MNIMEEILNELVQEKNSLETELEVTINSGMIKTEKIIKSKKLLNKISTTINSIDLLREYIDSNGKENNNS